MNAEQTAAVPVHPYRDRLRDHTCGRAHCIGHVTIFGKHHLATQAPPYFPVIDLDRPTHRHHGHGGLHAEGRQPELRRARTHGIQQLVLNGALRQRHAKGCFQNCAPGQAYGFAPDLVGIGRGSLRAGELHVPQAGTQLSGHLRGLRRPVALHAYHMGRIRRREAAHLHQPLALERGDGTLRRDGVSNFPIRLGAVRDNTQHIGLALRQLTSEMCCSLPLACSKRQQHEPAVHRPAAIYVCQVGLQHRQHLGVALANQGHRHHAVGADGDFAVGAKHYLTVAAQPNGAYINRPHHGAPAAHIGTVLRDPGSAIHQHAQVGRGAAHVRHDEAVQAREPLRPHQARCRAGQHGFNRPRGNRFSQCQRTVALDDHQRAVNVQLRHRAVHRLDQRRDA